MIFRPYWIRWPFSPLILCIVAMLLASCTFTVPIETTLDPPTKGAKVPLAVGIYYSVDFRTYEYVSTHGGDRWIFPLGPASVTLFDQVFPRVFASTRAVQSRPPLPTGDGALAAVIEPKIEAFDYRLAAFIGGTVSVEITYRFTLYSPRGDPIASWFVKGVGAKFARIDKVSLDPQVFLS